MLCHNRLICHSLSNAKAFVFSGGFPSVAYLYSPDEVNAPFLDSDVLWLLHNLKNPKNAKRETSPVETVYGTTLIWAGTGLAYIVPSCGLEKSVPSTFASWLLGCHLRGRNKERLAQSFPLMSYSAATWPCILTDYTIVSHSPDSEGKFVSKVREILLLAKWGEEW